MNEQVRNTVDAAIKQAVLMRKVKEDSIDFKTVDETLSFEELAEIFELFPEQDHLKHGDYQIDLSDCRLARREFTYWRGVLEDAASNRSQHLRAAEMLGRAEGNWYEGLQGFKMPFQSTLKVPESVLRDKELRRKFIAGFDEHLAMSMEKANAYYRLKMKKISAYFHTEFERTVRSLPSQTDAG